ncbi:MAG: hypothetical protein ACW98D_21830 [Promethearchaeota archaeon]|jgi:hypothetical protein
MYIISRRFLALITIFAFCFLCIGCKSSCAEELKWKNKNKYNLLNLKDDSDVYSELTPYLWFGGFNGHLSASSSSPLLGVDIKFNDLQNSIEINIPISASVKKGRWGWYGDLFFLRLDKSDRILAGNRGLRFSFQTDQLSFENSATFYLFKNDTIWGEAMLGARLWYLKYKFDILSLRTGATGITRGKETWVDPIIGFRTQVNLSRRWYLNFMANAGFTGIGSDETYGLFSTLGFRINKRMAVTTGYKYLTIDYNKQGFIFDLNQKGPYLAYSLFF